MIIDFVEVMAMNGEKKRMNEIISMYNLESQLYPLLRNDMELMEQMMLREEITE